jgi:hypothetical protein
MFNQSCVIDIGDELVGPSSTIPTQAQQSYLPGPIPTVHMHDTGYHLSGPVSPISIIPTTDHFPRAKYPEAVNIRSRSKSPPKYNGKFDFVDYLTQFECLAEDNGWDYHTCGRKLSLSLTDNARSILSTLDKSVRRDYRTLCQALMSLHTTPGGDGVKRTELHTATRTEGQCPSAFSRELRRLAARAYPTEPLPDAVLTQLFIKGLRDAQMERHVNLQDPQTLDEAVKHACAYMAYSSPVDRKPKPAAQPVAVVSANKPQNLQSQVVELAEKYDQLLKLVNQQRPKQSGLCFRCGQPGHIARRCPNQQPPHYTGRPNLNYGNQNAVQAVSAMPPSAYHFGVGPPPMNGNITTAATNDGTTQQPDAVRVFNNRPGEWYPETQNHLNW